MAGNAVLSSTRASRYFCHRVTTAWGGHGLASAGADIRTLTIAHESNERMFIFVYSPNRALHREPFLMCFLFLKQRLVKIGGRLVKHAQTSTSSSSVHWASSFPAAD